MSSKALKGIKLMEKYYPLTKPFIGMNPNLMNLIMLYPHPLNYSSPILSLHLKPYLKEPSDVYSYYDFMVWLS